MSKIKNYIIIVFSCLLLCFGGLFYSPNFTVNASTTLFTGDVLNNVIYVSFSDGDENFINSTPSKYTQNVLDLMDFSYNTSVSSVKNYYKAQSFNKLNLHSNFYSNNGTAYKTCYTENQLKPYSKSNTDGYLEYEICSYTGASAPSQLSSSYVFQTSHIFSCYDCGNKNHTGTGSDCDLSWGSGDDIACLCAYHKYLESNPSAKVHQYEHLEKYFREQVAIKKVLKQITSLNGNLDNNNDGEIDAITFIFPNSSNVGWSDLLWAHQSQLVNLSDYLGSFATPAAIQNLASAHGVRTESASNYELLVESNNFNSKTACAYNLYLLSDIVPSSKLVDGENNEILKIFTLAHELCHVLGLPDYYVYDDDEDEDAVYYWDLMSYSYVGVPTYLTTYNREILGFTNSNNIQKITQTGTYELYPTCYDEVNNGNENSNNVLAFVYEDSNYPNQKIYFEYRTKDGSFESGSTKLGRKDGLLIYRIDNGMKQVAGYNSMLSQGNFFGYPYNMYVFRNATNNYVLNATNTYFNDITFQNYDASKNQSILTKNDITYTNSGLEISNVKIQNGKLSFTISGGELTSPKDSSTIKLNGNETVNSEVKTEYVDAGIDYGNGGYTADDFNIVIDNQVNINSLGQYIYKYTLTSKTDSSLVLTFTRTVNVVDTTAPTITLIGKTTISLKDINSYIESGVNYEDNYFQESQLELVIGSLEQIETNKYRISYTVTENRTGGLSTTIYRYIIILEEDTDFSSITLIGQANVNHEVNLTYTDLGINFGATYTRSQFNVEVVDNVNINRNELGVFTYVYNLTYKETGEVYSLTRNVQIKDTTAPTIQISGDNEISLYLDEILSFSDKSKVIVSDNYNQLSDINITTRILKVSDEEYRCYYKATDKSGNESEEIYLTLKVKFEPVKESQITIKIGTTENQNIFTTIATRFAVEINFNDNNNKNPEIKISILENGTSIYYATSNEIYYKFTRAGVYSIKVSVGETEKITNIIVRDIESKPKDTKTVSTYVLVVFVAFFVIIVLAIIITKSIARKIKENLDRY